MVYYTILNTTVSLGWCTTTWKLQCLPSSQYHHIPFVITDIYVTLFIKTNFSALYCVYYCILFFSPVHFGIRWCHLQWGQSYCCLFSSHPNYHLDVLRRNNIKTDLPDRRRNTLDRKLVYDNMHNIVHRSWF